MDYYPVSKYLITFLIAIFVFIPINFICQKLEKRFKLNGFKKFLFYLFTFLLVIQLLVVYIIFLQFIVNIRRIIL